MAERTLATKVDAPIGRMHDREELGCRRSLQSGRDDQREPGHLVLIMTHREEWDDSNNELLALQTKQLSSLRVGWWVRSGAS
jgi:hypothetical protein